MFKFLRKYNKYILAVGGTLLLITFLIPFAFTQLLPALGRGGTWATVGDDHPQKISTNELSRIQRELQLIQNLGPIPALDTIDTPQYWYLLVREADEAGLIGPANLFANTEQMASQLAILSAATGESPSFIRETLARIQGVQRLVQLYADVGKYSDRRLRQRARRMFHMVSASTVVIEASAPDDPIEFTDRQLQEQLDAYADVVPGEGEKGFGYRLPDRAKIEWLEVPADQVRAMVEQSGDLNPVALRKHWKRNEDRLGTPDPASAVPEAVREDLLSTLTEKRLEQIAKFANDQLRLSRRGLSQRAGYLELPDDWQGLDLKELALRIQAEFGVSLPRYQAVGNRWLTAEDLAELPDVGLAATDKFGTTPMALPELVMSARELSGSSTITLQEGVAGPPLRGEDGSIFLFRIVDTDGSRPPDSIDEVRDELVADLNRLAHFERLEADVERIRQDAIDEGLLAVAVRYGTTVNAPTGISLGLGANLPTIGPDEEAVAQIIDHAMALPMDVPLRDLPEEDRILVIPVPEKLSILVVNLTDQSPLTTESFAFYMQNDIIQRRLFAEEFGTGEPIDEAFSYEALAKRHKFKLNRSTDKPDAEPDAAEDATAGY